MLIGDEDEVPVDENEIEQVEDDGDDGHGYEGGSEEDEGEGAGDSEGEQTEEEPERQDGVDTRVNDKLNAKSRRSQGHYREVESERNRFREEAEAARAEAASLKAERQREQAEANRVRQSQEQQRREQMLPEDRNAYDLQQIQAQLAYQDQMRIFEKADAQDSANYKATASVNPLYKRHEAAVEKSLAQLRASGQNMPREVLLRYHIGEEMLKNSQKNSKQLTPQKKRTVPKPTNSRADVSSTQGSKKPSSGSREDILKRIGDMPL